MNIPMDKNQSIHLTYTTQIQNEKEFKTMGNKEKQDRRIRILKERTFGEVIAARRKQLGWSQEELEGRTGISRVSISKIERSVVNPSYDSIEKLEEALHIPLFDIYRQDRKRKDEK